MPKRSILIAARLFFGLLTFGALATSFIYFVIQRDYNGVNFFSFFTNLTNIFAATVLVAGAIKLVRSTDPTETDDIIRGSATVSIAVVGIQRPRVSVSFGPPSSNWGNCP